jgi:hypothetical protein
MTDFRGIRDKVRKLVKFSAGWMSGCAKDASLVFAHGVVVCFRYLSRYRCQIRASLETHGVPSE